MSYHLYSFNSVLLPAKMAEDDLSAPLVDSPVVGLLGQAYDVWEAARKMPQRHTIQHVGMYVGDGIELATAAGQGIVTEADDRIITGNEGQAVRLQVDALKAQIGVQGTLYRVRESDSVLQWKTARLLAARHRQAVQDITVATVESVYESTMRAWRGASQQTLAITYVGRGYGMVENNGDLPIDNAIITIAATTAISYINAATTGVNWTWVGSLTAGQTLTIDCGAATILRGSTDVYSGLTLNASHTALSWLPLAVGGNGLWFSGDGEATITVKWYEQFA